jgi:hypothetical protein
LKAIQIDSPAKKYMPNDEEKDILASRITSDLESTREFFHTKMKDRNLYYDYYASEQWTAEEKAEHTEQNRHPYVFNEIQHKVDHLAGMEIQTKLEPRIIAREAGDEAQVELLNFMLKWADQINNTAEVQSEAFVDMVVGGATAAVVRWDTEDLVYGAPIVERVPINEIYWDTNAKRIDLSDARWMARVMYVTKYDALEQFPEYEEAIDKAEGTIAGNWTGAIYNKLTEHQEKTLNNQWTTLLLDERKVIIVVEYYERTKIYKYVVANEIEVDYKEFEQKEAAQSYYDGLVESYVTSNTDLINPDGTPRVSLLQTCHDVVQQTLMIGTEVVSHELTALTFFPYVIGFCYFNEGDYWSFVKGLIDPQMLVNRFFSQWDYQLGTAPKNVVTVMSSLLKKGWEIEDVRRELAKTAPVIPVHSHQAMNFVPPVPVNAELYQGINFAIGRMTDYSGGRNALGLQENAAESGRAVVARAEQGGLARLPLFDRMRLFRQEITMRMVWFMKNYMAPGQIIRVIGIDDEVQYVELEDGLLDTLKEIRYDIEIDEAMKSSSVRERNFQQLKELFSVVQLPPEIVVPMMLEYSEIPKSKKREIAQQLEFYQQYMQQKMEMEKEQKLTQEVQDSIKKSQMKEAMTMADQIGEQVQEAKREQKNLKTKLTDIEEMKMKMAESNMTLGEKSKMYDKLQTPEELAGRTTATLSTL